MKWLCALVMLLATLQPAGGAQAGNEADRLPPIHDHQVFWFALLDNFEYRAIEGTDAVAWDAMGWVGGDDTRLWLKTEGEKNTSDGERGEFEAQALLGRMISPFWDLQAGIRHDRSIGKGPNLFRTFAVLGVQGTAPYRFELEPALFLSQDGDLSFRLGGEYELLLIQRLVLQPSFEMNVALQEAKKYGVGRGLNDLELGLRLRYEVRREIAPYLGIVWKRSFGGTADLARDEGEDVSSTAWVGGVRLWF